jgi:S1-C subfamily serine protease
MNADQLDDSGATFTWSDIRTKTVEILLESHDTDGEWRDASLISGVVISADGLFLTAYHVMKFCLENDKGNDGLSVSIIR